MKTAQNRAQADAAPPPRDTVSGEDSKLRRRLGFWSLLATGIGSVIGSGWLFASMYAAQAAGPAALLAWVVAGALMLLIALVYAELGMVCPESGGLVRYPMYSNGRLAATVICLAMWLDYVGTPSAEAAGVLQYASAWIPGIYDATGGHLEPLGVVLATLLLGGFVLLNYFGVELFAKSNNVVTAIKILIPVLTVVLLLASGFDHRVSGGVANLTQHGGIAPLGWGTALGAVVSAGLIFTYTGFRNIVEHAGEAIDPHRDIPRALVATMVLTIVLYLALQVAFLIALPPSLLRAGWQGVNLESPFAALAQMLGLTWLSWLLMADAIVSPSGTALIYTSANARNLYGIAKNGFLPLALMRIHQRSGVPRIALLVNFVVGIAFLLPLPSWHAIVGSLGALTVITFSIGSVTLVVFRAHGVGSPAVRLRGMHVVAPLAFLVGSLVIYWASWTVLLPTVPVLVLAVAWYGLLLLRSTRRATLPPLDGRPAGLDDWQGGAWLVAYLSLMYALSYLGAPGGVGWLDQTWGTLLTVVASTACYVWGVKSGKRYMQGQNPAMLGAGASSPA